MAEDDNRGGAAGSILLGTFISLAFAAIAAGVVLYVEERDHRSDYLWSRLELEGRNNALLRAQIEEIVQDNQDLRRLLRRPAVPSPYPASTDPSDEPRP